MTSEQKKSRKKRLEKINQRKKQLKKVTLFLLLLIISSYLFDIKLVLFIISLIIVNSKLEKEIVRRGIPLRFELATFATVIAARVYGLEYGIALGLILRFTSSTYTVNFAPDHAFQAIILTIIALTSSILTELNVVVLGIFATIFFNAFMYITTKFLLGFADTLNIPLILSNAILSMVLFLSLGSAFVTILS